MSHIKIIRFQNYLLPVGEETLLGGLVQESHLGERLGVLKDVVICEHQVANVDGRREDQKTRGHEKQHGGQLTFLAGLTCSERNVVLKLTALFCCLELQVL